MTTPNIPSDDRPAPRPEGPPEGEAKTLGGDAMNADPQYPGVNQPPSVSSDPTPGAHLPTIPPGPFGENLCVDGELIPHQVLDNAQKRLLRSIARIEPPPQPAATEPRDIYHQTGRSMLETGNALLAKDAAATEPPATGATPETDAAWEAAPPADHGGMTAMRRCSESLETRLHAAEAEVRRLKDVCHDWQKRYVTQTESTIKDTASLRAQLQTATERAEGAERDRDDLRRQRDALLAYKREEFWIWQGDGTDYIESLTCRILIPAPELRSLFARLALADGLANEAQILVNIIKTNTQKGMCVLVRDMTIGTTAALTAYRAASAPGGTLTQFICQGCNQPVQTNQHCPRCERPPAATGMKGVAS